MKDFRDLKVWVKAHELTLKTYRITASFPKEERFGLISQIRRCCVSIPANIAEGCGRRGNGEFHRFLQTSSGSASELEYHFLLTKDLGFVDSVEYEDCQRRVVEVKRMLAGLIKKVEAERLADKSSSK